MSANGSRQDEDSRLPATGEDGGPPDAQDGPQPATEAETAALAEAEGGPAPSVSHIAAATIGTRDRRIVHGAHLVLSGAKLDGRTQRAVRLRCERIAKDRGFDKFQDAPTVLQAAIEGYVRLWLASDLMWASFTASFIAAGRGQLPDAFLDYQNAMHRKEVHLGLERRLKDAGVVDLQTYVGQKYGAKNGAP